ncbi:MAG: hypothetical protein C5B55_10705 [Blastocatellia bacterium]|nr:MAG: hypothetical protein C5B55_10705 [Blastocatellia bacterium]
MGRDAEGSRSSTTIKSLQKNEEKVLTIKQLNQLHLAFCKLIPRVAKRADMDRSYAYRIIKGQRRCEPIKLLLLEETRKILLRTIGVPR